MKGSVQMALGNLSLLSMIIMVFSWEKAAGLCNALDRAKSSSQRLQHVTSAGVLLQQSHREEAAAMSELLHCTYTRSQARCGVEIVSLQNPMKGNRWPVCIRCITTPHTWCPTSAAYVPYCAMWCVTNYNCNSLSMATKLRPPMPSLRHCRQRNTSKLVCCRTRKQA